MKTTVLFGTFVAFEGMADDDRNAWHTFPREVQDRSIDSARAIIRPGTFRFRFFNLQLLPHDAQQHFDGKQVTRKIDPSEQHDISPFFYIDCTELDRVFDAIHLPWTRPAQYSGELGRLVYLTDRAKAIVAKEGYRVVQAPVSCKFVLHPDDIIVP